jgi:acyl carrier protein phosphodiesterase
VNFFGHTVLAVKRSADPAFVLGSMLPDFATMIRARPPRTEHADIDSGIQFHWRTDEVFHRSPAFRTLTHRAFVWLSMRGVRSGSAHAVAHVGVEILLDAALSDDDGAQHAYRAALVGAAPADLGRRLGWASDEQRDRFDALRERLLARGAITREIAPDTVAERLRSVLADRPRLSLDDTSVQTVRDWARVARAEVSACAAPLVQDLSVQLL